MKFHLDIPGLKANRKKTTEKGKLRKCEGRKISGIPGDMIIQAKALPGLRRVEMGCVELLPAAKLKTEHPEDAAMEKKGPESSHGTPAKSGKSYFGPFNFKKR
jgi:hypothetical protein